MHARTPHRRWHANCRTHPCGSTLGERVTSHGSVALRHLPQRRRGFAVLAAACLQPAAGATPPAMRVVAQAQRRFLADSLDVHERDAVGMRPSPRGANGRGNRGARGCHRGGRSFVLRACVCVRACVRVREEARARERERERERERGRERERACLCLCPCLLSPRAGVKGHGCSRGESALLFPFTKGRQQLRPDLATLQAGSPLTLSTGTKKQMGNLQACLTCSGYPNSSRIGAQMGVP